MSRLVLGLDVSTSCTGLCIADADEESNKGEKFVRLLDSMQFKGCKSLWEKADEVEKKLLEFKNSGITVFALEEPLMGFRTGMSSAATITTLMKFNGIVSYIGRQIFGLEPVYISSSTARKTCGIKVQKTSKVGISGKEQVFSYMMENDLSHVTWPKKKNGNDVDWSRDAVDAYVIARAACLLQNNGS